MKKIIFSLLPLVLLLDCTQTTNEVFDEPTSGSSSVKINLLSLCLAFTTNDYMNTCAAAMGGNYSLCTTQECLAYAGAANKDSSVCINVTTYQPDDCITTVAMASLDDSICPSASSPSGCSFEVKAAKPLSIEDCKVRQTDYETGCIFNYAWQNNATEACSKLTDIMGFRISCLAMLSGSDADCDPLRSVGVNEWFYCHIKSFYLAVMPSKGIFNPDLCLGEEDCEYYVLREMINYAARN